MITLEAPPEELTLEAPTFEFLGDLDDLVVIRPGDKLTRGPVNSCSGCQSSASCTPCGTCSSCSCTARPGPFSCVVINPNPVINPAPVIGPIIGPVRTGGTR